MGGEIWFTREGGNNVGWGDVNHGVLIYTMERTDTAKVVNCISNDSRIPAFLVRVYGHMRCALGRQIRETCLSDIKFCKGCLERSSGFIRRVGRVHNHSRFIRK